MAIGYEYRGLTIAKIAEAEITACRFVKFGTTSEKVDVCGAGERALGVASGVPGEVFAIGEVVDVMIDGIAMVQATDNSANALGDMLEAGALGRATHAETNKNPVAGMSVGPVAGATDTMLAILLEPSVMSCT